MPVYKLQMVQTHHCQGTALLTGLLPGLLKPFFFCFFSGFFKSSEGTPSDICFGGKHPRTMDKIFKAGKATYILRDASQMQC